MATSDLSGTTLEFVASYGTTYTTVGSYAAIAAFGTGAGAIVTVSINAVSKLQQTIDAGAYAHLVDTSGVGLYQPIFDIGYSSSASTTSSVVNNGANATLATGAASNSTEGFGTLELSGTIAANAASISFLGTNNTLILDTAANASYRALTNFSAAGDQVVFNGVTATNAAITSFVYTPTGSTLTFVAGGVTSMLLFYGLPSTAAIGNFKLGSAAVLEGGNSSTYAGNLVLSYVPCFLRGTMIDTPFGERAVEDIREGDLVTALVDGRLIPSPVRWVGGGAMDVSRHAFRDSAFPVRILRHAFGPNLPHRDLLVTPEHCVLTENGLVPARMLVNGGSILIDRDLTSYDYFHIELDRHSIILSEALPTESYLDGDNRMQLDRGPAGTRSAQLAPPSAAPLAVSQALVEPVWRALNARAERLGLRAPLQPGPCMTDDPALRLLLDDGSEIAACRRDAQRHMFHIPRGARPTRLRSRASVPSEVVGPFVDDRRLLGVAVDRMVLWNGLEGQEMAPGDTPLGGWHSDNSAARWTNGDAELDLPAAEDDCFLDVHVTGTLPYRSV